MFGQSFEGQTRSRPTINLSGSAAAGGSTSSASSSAGPSTPGEHSIANRARQERAHREQQRKLDRTARTIQAFYRSRQSAGSARDAIRQEYDALAIGSSSTTDSRTLLHATRLLAFIFTPVVKARKPASRRKCSRADLDRLGRWSRTVAVGKPRVALFQLFDELGGDQNDLQRYAFLLQRLARVMLAQAADNASSPTIPLLLELTRQLLDPTKYNGLAGDRLKGFPQQLAAYLVAQGGLDDLRTHILSFPAGQKPLPPSIAPTVSISLSLLLRTNGTLSHDAACQSYLSSILTIPQVLTPRRLSPNALNSLLGPSSTLPVFNLLDTLSKTASPAQDSATQLRYAYLLSNLITLISKRLMPAHAATANAASGLKNGKELVTILDAFRICLDNLPAGILVGEPKGKSAASAIDIEDEDAMLTDEVGQSASLAKAATAALDPYTYSSIEQLASESLLSALVAASTRYSGTSRPALSSFLVALIYSWPAKRETIVNTLVYSDMVAAGRGVIRELWRGWIRSSALNKAISGPSGQASSSLTSSIINTFTNSQYKDDWPHLILLAELYARTLLTLGDDEFFANASGSGPRGSVPLSRNPLTTDEVIGLSGLFRNIAFALYWQPEVLTIAQTGQQNYVVGSKVSLEGLRALSTHLLQMIHARDSRRKFTPPNHWIMTSQIDVKSFIESVLVEDRELNDEEHGTGTADAAMDDSDDEEAFGRRAPAMRKRNIPSRRQMAYVSPRLGVLNNIPFVIPFETRVSIFQQFIANDRYRLGLAGVDRSFNFGLDGRGIAGRGTIRRGHVADDGFRAFAGLGSHLKGRLAIRFIDEYGQEEAGIDGGGLFKEFLTSLSKEAFDIDRGLWAENANHELYPTSTSYSRESHSLQWYAFLGRMMGKALYEGILVDVPFAPFFLSKWLGRASGFDDLASFDPDLYQGLVQLKNYTGNVEKDMSLNFTVSEEDFGVSRTIDLIPNGSSVPVTNENRISYIYRVSDYRLNKQIERQCSAFFSGLSDLVDPKWLRMFNQVELGLLVGGAETGIDIEDLRHNTVYPRDYDESNPTIQYFWKAVESFSQEDKKALIKFCTSCPRPPLLGFSQLNPKFSIAPGGADENRMPSASTCVNLLKLPTYSSPERLKQKLLASIHSGAGFDLS